MPLEIEIKLAVKSHAPIRTALKKAGGIYVRTVLETNTFFDRKDGSLRAADTGLRVRQSKVEAGKPITGALLTFKGPKQKTGLKSRNAYDLTLTPPNQIVPLLKALGFHPTLSFEKRRESWTLNNCLVELDHMPGKKLFMEIEGPTERAVQSVRKLLNLENIPPTEESYSAMMGKLAKLNPQWRDRIRLNSILRSQ